jgi:hypothetical protein
MWSKTFSASLATLPAVFQNQTHEWQLLGLIFEILFRERRSAASHFAPARIPEPFSHQSPVKNFSSRFHL